MVKSKALLVKVESEFLEQVNAKVAETGVPYAVVVRRAVEHWLLTGEMLPAQPIKAKGGKRKTTAKV